MNINVCKNRILMFILATIMGYGLQRSDVPIPYMLGGILAGIVFRGFVDRYILWPKNWREIALVVAGYGIGRNFSMDTVQQLSTQMIGVFGATLIAIGVSVVVAWWTNHHTYANLISCVMGIMPGGLTQMVLMSEEDGRADANVVVLMQTLRVIGVVVSVPFLVVKLLGAQILPVEQAATAAVQGVSWLYLFPVGALGVWLAMKLHIANPTLMGPILATAGFSVAVGHLQAVPNLLMAIAQINIGLYMGCMLDKSKLYEGRVLLPYIFGGTALMIGVSIGVAFVLSSYYQFSPIAAFLAMAPGGIAEMCLAGMSMGEDVSIILTYQIVRLIMLNLTVPPAINYYFNKAYKG